MFTLQTLPASDPEEPYGDAVGKVVGFSLHAGVAARADERKQLDHLKHKAETNEPSPLPESRAPPAGLQPGLFT